MSQAAIDVGHIEVESLIEKAFPAASRFRILISEQAHAAIWQHARETLLDSQDIKEVGGVLVGDVYKDSQGPFLEVKAGIVARHTRNEGTEVAFTPETWEQVNLEKDKLYPRDRIVGWYHTHPRFGIFLSERDKFIQQHSFPQPWATAFVLDPVQKTEGFFFWSQGEPEEAIEYWVGEEHRLPSHAKEKREENLNDADASAEPHNSFLQAGFTFALTLCLLSLLFAFGYSYWREGKRSARDKLFLRGLESQQAVIDRSLQTAASLTSEVKEQGAQTPADVTQPPASADQQMRNPAQELENDLRQLSNITLSLKAMINDQQQLSRATSEGGNPTRQQPLITAIQAGTP